MPYPAGHKKNVREKIIRSARRLFNRHGFDKVSIDDIMAGVELTRGGFYSYFGSKSDLYTDVLSCFFTDPQWQNSWEGVQVDLDAASAGPQIVRAYLSQQHFESIEDCCPMVALPGDVARGGKRAQNAFENVFQAMVQHLQRGAAGDDKKRKTTAQAVAALCVGGMVVARALGDRELADDLRNSCMRVALEIGGWPRAPKARRKPVHARTASSTRAQA